MAAQAKSDQSTVDPQLIVESVESADLTQFAAAWSALDELSTHTQIDGIEVDPAGIVWEGKTFRGLMSIYVLLSYGSKSDDGFEETDAFSADFEGHIGEDGKPRIDTINVDTSPFFEEDPRGAQP